jgi:hypothetical protein
MVVPEGTYHVCSYAEVIAKLLLSQTRNRMDDAASVARTPEACANSGNLKKATQTVIDVE